MKIIEQLSSESLFKAKALFLTKIQNFSVTPKEISQVDIISLIELTVPTFSKENADFIRFKTAKCLSSARLSQ